MGEFDWGALQDLQKEFGLDPIEDFGFDKDMAEMNFPELDFGSDEKEEKKKVMTPEDLQAIRDRKKTVRGRMKEEQDEYGSYKTGAKGCVTLVFSGETQKRAWLTSIEADPETRVIMAEDILDLRNLSDSEAAGTDDPFGAGPQDE